MPTDAEGFVAAVRNTLRRHRLIAPGDTVLTAVSGGPDSMALLHAIRALGISQEVAHFDHQTRDGASADDAAFVRAESERMGLPFHIESRPVAREARALGLTFEEHARGLRYGFLLRTATARGCAVVATGHHADDQAETVLMRILRGTGPSGLAGIPPVREESGIRIVRPLFDVRRADIVAWLDLAGIAYRTDASNADPAFFRNRLRHELMPLLERGYNPQVGDALRRLADTARVENDLLEAMARAFYQACFHGDRVDRHAFAQGHRAVQRRALAMLAWRRGVEPAFDRIDGAVDFLAAGVAGLAYDLGGGVLLRNGRARADVAGIPAAHDGVAQPLAAPGEAEAFARRFRVRYLDSVPADDPRRYCRPDRQVFDADAVEGSLTVRRWRPGDRFTPLGMKGTRKLQDYYTDLGLTPAEKAEQPLLVDDRGILWVVGRAIDARGALTPATRRAVEVEVLDAAQ